MTENDKSSRSFWERSNDLENRQWPFRLTRFLRGRLRGFCGKLILLAEDPRALQIWGKGWDPDHYVRLRRWHDKGFRPQVVFDIGAHVGGWSEMCHSIFAPPQMVLFEPQPDLASQARTRRPSAAAWKVLEVALGSQTESKPLYVTQNAAASSMLAPIDGPVPKEWGTGAVGQKTVMVEPLDHLAAREKLALPDLVKIDVQGYEGQVLTGGEKVLSQAQRLVIEVSLRPLYDGQALLPDVLRTVSAWGFELEDMHETCREWAGPLWQVDLWLKRSR